jgi:hypothetical protein
MGTAVRPAKTSPGPWDAFADIDVFVDEVLAELEIMAKEGARPVRSGPKPPLAGAALHKAVMATWCVCFCGMQWRAIGRSCQDWRQRNEFWSLLACVGLNAADHDRAIARFVSILLITAILARALTEPSSGGRPSEPSRYN